MTYTTTSEGFAFHALPAAAYTSDLNAARATSNVKITTPGTYTLNASKTINALLLGPGVTVNGPGGALSIGTGTVVFAGVGQSELAVENISLGSSAVIHTAAEGTVGKISGNIYSAGSNINKTAAVSCNCLAIITSPPPWLSMKEFSLCKAPLRLERQPAEHSFVKVRRWNWITWAP